jgi:sensor histidine kinase YesM
MRYSIGATSQLSNKLSGAIGGGSLDADFQSAQWVSTRQRHSTMTCTLKFTLRQSIACFLAWMVLGLFMFSQWAIQPITQKGPYPWWQHLASFLVAGCVWFVLTPLVLWLGRRFSLERMHWTGWTLIHLFLGAAVVILNFSMESAVYRLLGIYPGLMTSFLATLTFVIIVSFHNAYWMYWTILAVQYGFGWYHKSEERKREALRLELHSSQLQSQLMEARLRTLKMQIQPHFLFNTLNAIMVLVRQQKGSEAEQMLSRLSDLLRCVLDDVDTQEVSLRRELEYVQLYLSIEQVRFHDRLGIEIAPQPETLKAAVPHMILQPLVENAIRHGIGRSALPGKIRISARRVEDRLEMKVHNDGPRMAESNTAHARGIGLANTRARLSQLYGDAAGLSIENDAGGGVTATIILPWQLLFAAPEKGVLEIHDLHRVAC